MAIGAISAVLGVLYALAEKDIKRLLAYSTVENVGIILMGVGVGISGVAVGMEVPVAAVLVHMDMDPLAVQLPEHARAQSNDHHADDQRYRTEYDVCTAGA